MAVEEPKFENGTRAFVCGCAAAVGAGLLANTGLVAVAIPCAFLIGELVGIFALKDKKTVWPTIGSLIGSQVGWAALAI